jgi:exopolysaccharide biosynthesis polyprenyl glycosylphosphotransferase
VSKIFGGVTIGVAILIVITFYAQPGALSRLMFVYAWISITAILSLERLVERGVRAYLRSRGIGIERVLVVGAGEAGRLLMQNIAVQSELGLTVVGFLDDERTEDLGKFTSLGTLRDIRRVVAEQSIDEVIVTLPASAHTHTSRILTACSQRNIRCRIVPDFFEISLNQVDVSELNGIPLLSVREYPLHGTMRILKRLSDIAMAAALLVGFSPIMALVALAIKFDSPGPIFFRQERVGRNGRYFPLLKFRSMYIDAEDRLAPLVKQNEASGPLFKMKKDPRLTRVGRVIRRLSIDELPQLFNVVQGDMSLVGPRPGLPAEVEAYEEWHRRRLEVRPGMTGLWQVSGRSNLSFEEMVLLDIWYIEYWSPALDFKIILRTVPAVLFGIGAY